ncbi:MAG: DPP IV N-terminal domain-containing protein, partial [Chloroflexi bacterium]|nr:DPP IV N-terminal domain-containing protein [Chloroflexota bacterium]
AQPASAGPAGKLVVRGADGLLYVVNANGTGLRQLTDGIDPSWSPPTGGQQRITFVRWREPWGLYVINADGTGERRINTDKHLRGPAWSPDGSIIATLRGRLETIQPKVIVIPGWGTFVISPGGEVWLHVLKAVNPNNGAYEGDYPTDAFIQSPSWAPDGKQLVYDGDRGIMISAMGEDPRLLTPDLIEANSMTPVWSPQGNRIAYVRWMHNHWEIWSMNTAGGDKQRLTPAGVEIGQKAYNSAAPAWSPDGRHIAFLTDRAGKWQVYVMHANGTGQSKLLDLPVAYEFNGDRILDWTR